MILAFVVAATTFRVSGWHRRWDPSANEEWEYVSVTRVEPLCSRGRFPFLSLLRSLSLSSYSLSCFVLPLSCTLPLTSFSFFLFQSRHLLGFILSLPYYRPLSASHLVICLFCAPYFTLPLSPHISISVSVYPHSLILLFSFVHLTLSATLLLLTRPSPFIVDVLDFKE